MREEEQTRKSNFPTLDTFNFGAGNEMEANKLEIMTSIKKNKLKLLLKVYKTDRINKNKPVEQI